MKNIPLSIFPQPFLRRVSPIFDSFSSRLENNMPMLKVHLKKAKLDFNSKEYIGMCMASGLLFFILLSFFAVVFTGGFNPINSNQPLVTGMVTLQDVSPAKMTMGIVAVIFIIAGFIFLQQLSYPKLKAYQNIKNIDRNLLPALQHLLIQLNAGTPLFEAIVGVTASEYGGVSDQFRIAVRRINAGTNQIRALEEVAEENPSPYFRRAIWQITTGMKTGSDISKVLENTIENLSEEQLIQIQRYGSQLNPLAMFYMLGAVILPSLGITFIMVLSSFMGLEGVIIKTIFWVLLVAVFFFQVMFLGVIKSRRPNLLE